MSDDEHLPKPIAVVVSITTSIITLITAIVGLILLWRGNSKIVSTVVVSISFLGLWGSLFYIKFARKTTRKTPIHSEPGQRKRNKKPGYLFSAKIRRVALMGIIITPVLGLLGGGIYYIQVNRPPKDVVVLIFEFEGPEPQKYGVTQFFDEKISQITKGLNYVEVKTTKDIISASDGYLVANRLGEANKANLVVWGWYVATNDGISVTYHITTIQHNFGLGITQTLDSPNNLKSTTSKIEPFRFQSKELADNLVLDTLGGISSALFDKKEWKKALEIDNLSLKFLENNSDSFIDFQRRKSSLLSEIAVERFVDGDRQNAITEATNAINYYPSYETYLNRGMLYYSMGNIPTAIQDVEVSIPYNPSNAGAYINLAAFYDKQGNTKSTIEILSQGIENIEVCNIENICHVLYYKRGYAYLHEGRQQEAIADFNKVKEIINDPEINKWIDGIIENIQ